MRKLLLVLLFSVAAMTVATSVFAADDVKTAESLRWSLITAGFAMAIASGLCGIAQSRAVAAACMGVARNPGAADSIRFFLILGLALIESLALYTLVIVLKFTWINPLY